MIEQTVVTNVVCDEVDLSAAETELQPPISATNEPARDIIAEPWGIPALLETLLFVAEGPVEIGQLTKTLQMSNEAVIQYLKELDYHYLQTGRGLRVQEYHGKFQLVTNPTLATLIETFLNLDLTTKLSASALETLAIIAYRQPITRAQIEAVRGVDSSAILRSLVQRGLIEESGRLEGVGRPILYGVTEAFLHHFGLTGLHELPTLESTEADTLWAATVLAES
ncbi:MAG: SMC-Scp complex subunit ScpB [Caldilineaceae bacterium]|nr:SMC-Scp complex subunit ScpB [Caldilineaceae bacterium]